jgi:Regulator of G protein signaling domain
LGFGSKGEEDQESALFFTKSSAMITRKVHFVSSTVKPWILSPETSPQLSPVISDWDADDEASMSADDITVSRPISIANPSREVANSGSRPTLDDILNGHSLPPYTLSAFTAYLSQQHCLETLEFTMEAKKYQEIYAQTAANLAGMPMNHDHQDVCDLQRHWVRILDVYIKPGSPREINLSSEVRDGLLDEMYSQKPPQPEALDPAVQRMYDLMGESIFMPFLNSFNPAVRATTFSVAESDFGGRRQGRPDMSTSLLDERADILRRKSSRRHGSPPSSSSIEFSAPRSPTLATSHRHTQSSGIATAIGRTSGARLSTHVSNSSAASGQEYLTDDSGSADSPGSVDPMTPPTTPPGSDLHMEPLPRRHSPNPSRSDGGNWMKKGMRLLGKRKTGGPSLRERSDEG